MAEFLQFLQDWGGLILSGFSGVIAVISIIQSSKAQKMQKKINELDAKIKEYELEKIEKEKMEAASSIIKARAVKVGKNNYRLKIYNTGNDCRYHLFCCSTELSWILRRLRRKGMLWRKSRSLRI